MHQYIHARGKVSAAYSMTRRPGDLCMHAHAACKQHAHSHGALHIVSTMHFAGLQRTAAATTTLCLDVKEHFQVSCVPRFANRLGQVGTDVVAELGAVCFRGSACLVEEKAADPALERFVYQRHVLCPRLQFAPFFEFNVRCGIKQRGL